jgi:ribosomal protein S18 acetylase RimI-like enzyme
MEVKIRQSTVFDIETEDGLLISSCLVCGYRDGVQLARVYTSTEYRCQGYATTLIHAVLRYYSKSPVYLVPESCFDAPMTNTELRSWYKRLGFIPTQQTEKIMIKIPQDWDELE